MIDRYCRPEMAALWNEEFKFCSWLTVEVAILDAWAKVGAVPTADAQAVREAYDASLERVDGRVVGSRLINLARIHEIEAVFDHDLIAFVKSIEEQLGDEGSHLHFGVTSYDVEDTALAWRLVRALRLIRDGVAALRAAIHTRAKEHRDTVMMGRTHGVHAEPVTLGFKLCVWLDDLDRSVERIDELAPRLAVGKISGAVGTYANVTPDVERRVCELLSESDFPVTPAKVSTQIIARDRHAEAVCLLALIAGQLERMATEVRNLQRTEILELSEPFKQGQRGSSAMPHKRNPWRCETVSGLARVVRGMVIPALENITTWHERDLANSSVERVILPDAFQTVDFMLHRFRAIVEKMVVHDDNMARNVTLTQGVIYSQQVRLALTDSGLSYDQAYDLAQRYALQAWNERVPYRQLLEADPVVSEQLTSDQLDACFDPSYHLQHLGAVYERFGL